LQIKYYFIGLFAVRSLILPKALQRKNFTIFLRRVKIIFAFIAERMPSMNEKDYIELVRMALAEDVGAGDVTTMATIDPDAIGIGYIKTKQEAIVCGLEVARSVFTEFDRSLRVDIRAPEGEWAIAGDILMAVSGSIASMLSAERTALNFLQRMCGIATLTASFVSAASGTSARITDTRKTLPGYRALDKYAVKIGGGYNHRFGLYDGVLIKSNHIDASGGVKQAVAAAKMRAHHLLKIEAEARTLEEAIAACNAGADFILLDNMTPQQIVQAVEALKGRCKLEASGGVNIDNVAEYAATGVDFISIGAITHSVKAVDLHMAIGKS